MNYFFIIFVISFFTVCQASEPSPLPDLSTPEDRYAYYMEVKKSDPQRAIIIAHHFGIDTSPSGPTIAPPIQAAVPANLAGIIDFGGFEAALCFDE